MVKSVLAERGIELVGQTDELSIGRLFSGGPVIRRMEIQKYVEENLDSNEKWIALDDTDLGQGDKDFQKHFVRTHPFRGLTDDTYEEAHQKLQRAKFLPEVED